MAEYKNSNSELAPLEALVGNTCFCKLKSSCSDKTSTECMRERNIYAEFMKQKDTQKRV